MDNSRVGAPILALAISGCIVPIAADGGFTVVGTLVPEAGICDLVLARASGTEPPLSMSRVSGAFREGFVVSPYAGDYRVSVVCGGVVRKSATVRHGAEVKPGESVHLGTIAL